jgi:hypothetical protein
MDVAGVRVKVGELSAELAALGVKSLSVFGSVATGQAREDSDLDFLVEFHGRSTFQGFMGLKELLEREFGARIDLVTVRALKPELRDQILTEAVKVA